MRRITVDCPTCGGASQIPPAAALVAAAEDGGSSAGSLAFVCLSCRDLVWSPVTPRGASVIAQAGNAPMSIAYAMPHPESAPPGPSLTADDLLDLHVSLADDTALRDWLTTSGSQQPGS